MQANPADRQAYLIIGYRTYPCKRLCTINADQRRVPIAKHKCNVPELIDVERAIPLCQAHPRKDITCTVTNNWLHWLSYAHKSTPYLLKAGLTACCH